jgi:hypothetical protein
MKLHWEKQDHQLMESYIDKEEAVQIFIIKTVFEDVYIIVYDDAEQSLLGKTNLATKAQIKDDFGIDITI